MISGFTGFGMWILISIADIQNGTVPESIASFATEKQCLEAKKEKVNPEQWTCQLSDVR